MTTPDLAALLHAEFTRYEDEDGVPEPCSLCDARAARLHAAGVRVTTGEAEPPCPEDCPYCAGEMCARFDGLNCQHDSAERHGYPLCFDPSAHAAGVRVTGEAGLRERVWKAQHDTSCSDGKPHEWTDHLPWDSDDDREDAEREADAIIAALAGDPEPAP